MDNLKECELLAPAGDMECVRTDIKYGADAVYCGGPFMQLRAGSAGFTMETLAEAASLLHAQGRKLYVTVNSFAWSHEIPRLGDYANELKDIGVDALIVSDLGAICEIKEKAPGMEVHVSTQANCMNYKAAETYYNLGAARIVLARELSIEKIADIRAKAPRGLELEAFVHGAMCMSYSGRCLLSAYLTGRSGNRGECAQACRWNYYLMEEKRPGEYFKIEESSTGSAILSSKELCAIELLNELRAAGICSFKIEGRMRTPFYNGTVVNAYRMAMDGTAAMEDIKAELDTVSHRPFCTGFYVGDPEALAPDVGGYIRDYLFVATAEAASCNGRLDIITRNPFKLGDELEALTPGQVGRSFTVTHMEDAEGEKMQRSATPMRHITINAPDDIQLGDIIRMKK